jgi:hypothetical protein
MIKMTTLSIYARAIDENEYKIGVFIDKIMYLKAYKTKKTIHFMPTFEPDIRCAKELIFFLAEQFDNHVFYFQQEHIDKWLGKLKGAKLLKDLGFYSITQQQVRILNKFDYLSLGAPGWIKGVASSAVIQLQRDLVDITSFIQKTRTYDSTSLFDLFFHNKKEVVFYFQGLQGRIDLDFLIDRKLHATIKNRPEYNETIVLDDKIKLKTKLARYFKKIQDEQRLAVLFTPLRFHFDKVVATIINNNYGWNSPQRKKVSVIADRIYVYLKEMVDQSEIEKQMAQVPQKDQIRVLNDVGLLKLFDVYFLIHHNSDVEMFEIQEEAHQRFTQALLLIEKKKISKLLDNF